jgi:hypothetical protein
MSAPIKPVDLDAPMSTDGKPETMTEGTFIRLKEAFTLIDTDASGFIDVEEFQTLLKLQGEDMSKEDVQKIVGDKPQGLSFGEFLKIMENVEGGASTADMLQSVAKQAKQVTGAFNANVPLYEQMRLQAQDGGVKFSSSKNARMKLAAILDGNNTQLVIMVLIALDVVAVILELVVHDLYCPCSDRYTDSWDTLAYGSKPHPWHSYGALGYGADYGGGQYYGRRLDIDETSVPVNPNKVWGFTVNKVSWQDIFNFVGYESADGYDDSAHRQLAGGGVALCPTTKQYEYTLWLTCISLGILWMFAFQILGLIIVYGPVDFFSSFFYVADFIVVYGALVLEMPYMCSNEDVAAAHRRRLGGEENDGHDFFETDDYGGTHFGCVNIANGGALVTMILCWRVLRVVHGIFTSIELQEEKRHEAVSLKQNELLTTLKATRRNFAKERFVHSKYHDKLVEMGVRYLAEGEHHSGEGAMSMEQVPIEELKERLSESERMYATLFSKVESHHEDLHAAEKRLSEGAHGHGSSHGAAEH